MFTGSPPSRSPILDVVAVTGGLIATVVAIMLGAVLAVIATITVLVIGLGSSLMIGLAGLAGRARPRAVVPGEDGILEAAHETGADDEVAVGGLELVADGLLRCGAEAVWVIAGVDPGGGNIPGPGPVEDAGLRVIGKYEGDFRG